MKPQHIIDPSILDLAMRDLPTLRAAARRHAERDESEKGGIGAACGMQKYADVVPTCYDLDHLDKYYNPDVAGVRNLAASTVATITPNPLSDYVVPVGIAAVGFSSTDPADPLPFWAFSADINGCKQFNFENATPTVAAATAYLHSSLWNPFARGCKACPISWGAYGNQSHRNRLLTITVANPNPIPMDIMVFIYGVTFDCCPIWTNADDFNRPQRLPLPEPMPVPVPSVRGPGPGSPARPGAFG